jgi:hypothetical protein
MCISFGYEHRTFASLQGPPRGRDPTRDLGRLVLECWDGGHARRALDQDGPRAGSPADWTDALPGGYRGQRAECPLGNPGAGRLPVDDREARPGESGAPQHQSQNRGLGSPNHRLPAIRKRSSGHGLAPRFSDGSPCLCGLYLFIRGHQGTYRTLRI